MKGSMESLRGEAITEVDGEAKMRDGAPAEVEGAADSSWNNEKITRRTTPWRSR